MNIHVENKYWLNTLAPEWLLNYTTYQTFKVRHTYATELVMSGVNPVVVKDLMRHSDISTTWSIYTHPQNEDQRKALDNLYMEMK